MLFFRLDLRLHRFHGGALRDNAAVFRHGAGKIFGADFTREVNNVLFIVRNQRTQNQRVRDVVDQAQVGQRLAGNLA